MTKAYLRKDLVEAGEVPPSSRGYQRIDWNEAVFEVIGLGDEEFETQEGFNLCLTSPATGAFLCASIDFEFTE